MAEENQGTQVVDPQENRKPNLHNNKRPNNNRSSSAQGAENKPNSNLNKNNYNLLIFSFLFKISLKTLKL